MPINLPARIRKMNKRRRKIALRKMFSADLEKFIGQPINQDTGQQVATALVDKYGEGIAHSYYQPLEFEVLGVTSPEPDKTVIEIRVQGQSMVG